MRSVDVAGIGRLFSQLATAQGGIDVNDKKLVSKIRLANKSWSRRAASSVQDIQYDSNADIFYANYGAIADAFSMAVDDPDDLVYVRIDVQTFEIIGFEIMSFKQIFLTHHPELKKNLDEIMAVFGDADWRFQLLPNSEMAGTQASVPAAQASIGYLSSFLPKVAPDLVSA